jgi:L-asparaginase
LAVAYRLAVVTRVHVVATGGTIAMAGSPARPAHSAAELVEAVPGLRAVADVTVEQLSNVPGVQLTPAAMARAGQAAAAAVSDGADGVVITQGTDSIEETADLLDLLWPHNAPLVVTGAMRPAGTTGADGPANLLDAVTAAAALETRGTGALVVFDGLVHAGSAAVKSHSWRTEGFSSPAPLGEVREGRVWMRPRLRGKPAASLERAAESPLDAFVPIVGAAAGMDSRALETLLTDGPDAIVLIALGAGHVPAAMLPGVDRVLEANVPLIVCARTAEGGTLERTYGFEGSESDLAERGAILAGAASPWKARVRAVLALGLGLELRSLF